MSAEGSRRAVIAALAANLGIAVSKGVAFFITGSGSMLAEAAHSVADSGNQGLLLLGSARAKRAADQGRPFGYAREAYFSAFVVAIVLFTAGAGFAVREGIHKLHDPHTLESPMVAIVVLALGLMLETLSFRSAIVVAQPLRAGRSWWRFIRENKTAELTVVLLEDAAALLGLVLALIGVGVATITHDSAWDAYGTLAIGALLAVIAIVLAVETKSLLIGESAAPPVVAAIQEALGAQPEFDRVVHLRTEHRGPSELLVAAKVGVEPSLRADVLARAIDEAEKRIRAAVPEARYVFIEPDLPR